MARYFILSVAIHALILLLTSLTPISVPPPPADPPSNEKKDLPIRIKNTSPVGITGCEHTYQGIGIMFDPYTNIIIDVPEGLPAYKHGIRSGDYLYNPWEPKPEKGPLVLRVRRDGKSFDVSIPQDDICYE